MKAYLYCDVRSLNEATLYYVGLVESCLKDAGYECKRALNLSDINKPDLIFTITMVYYTKAKIRFPFVKTISWIQGLGFQEAKMTRPLWKWLPHLISEAITIYSADLLLFVSEKMRDYYKTSFGYKKSNYVIMPCYNLKLSSFFNLDKYNKPTFVYAGGVTKWQSIDSILDTYSLVEQQIPDASLTLYCKDSAWLRNELAYRGIKNFEIKYVSVTTLQQELLQFKYGFILREKNWVNMVATPTKMNSYLAAYVIPVFSDAVDDFVKNIKLSDYTLCAHTPLEPQKIAEQIIEFEKKTRDYSLYKSIVDKVFDVHYNDSKYIDMIGGEISKLQNTNKVMKCLLK